MERKQSLRARIALGLVEVIARFFGRFGRDPYYELAGVDPRPAAAAIRRRRRLRRLA